MRVQPFDEVRRARAKAAFSTRRADKGSMATILSGNLKPKAGDLVLARVDELGKQSRIELADGRRAFLYPGDEIIVAYGNRYAPDQYEAVIGVDLSPCDLVAAGGVAGVELARNLKMISPTQITPVGLIGDEDGRVLNLMDFRVEAPDTLPNIPAILSLGTSMNAGKSLTAASLIKGFKRLGYKVASLKVTGTGSGGDLWIASDAGADVVADFTDAGYASTYLTPIHELETATYRLMNYAAAQGCDLAVIEIADGLQQLETAQLIRSEAILGVTLGSVFSAFDSMGAGAGAELLRRFGHRLISLCGRIGLAPLGVREAELATGLVYHAPLDLQDGVLIPKLRRLAAERVEEMPEGMHETLLRFAGDTSDLIGGPDRPEVAAGQKVLQLVADFVIRRSTPAAALNGTATSSTVHRIWQTRLGLIHLILPRFSGETREPEFLAQDVAPELVDGIVSAYGTPSFFGALNRLVLVLGGPDMADCDLTALGVRVEAACASSGVQRPEEMTASLTIDDFSANLPFHEEEFPVFAEMRGSSEDHLVTYPHGAGLRETRDQGLNEYRSTGSQGGY